MSSGTLLYLYFADVSVFAGDRFFETPEITLAAPSSISSSSCSGSILAPSGDQRLKTKADVPRATHDLIEHRKITTAPIHLEPTYIIGLSGKPRRLQSHNSAEPREFRGRTWSGHPPWGGDCRCRKTWMPGTSPGKGLLGAKFVGKRLQQMPVNFPRTAVIVWSRMRMVQSPSASADAAGNRRPFFQGWATARWRLGILGGHGHLLRSRPLQPQRPIAVDQLRYPIEKGRLRRKRTAATTAASVFDLSLISRRRSPVTDQTSSVQSSSLRIAQQYLTRQGFFQDLLDAQLGRSSIDCRVTGCGDHDRGQRAAALSQL